MLTRTLAAAAVAVAAAVSGAQTADAQPVASCDQAWAQGIAPMQQGQATYDPALDRDGDGVACETPPGSTQSSAGCPEGQVIEDLPSTSYWICQSGSYVYVRDGSDPDSGEGYGQRGTQ